MQVIYNYVHETNYGSAETIIYWNVIVKCGDDGKTTLLMLMILLYLLLSNYKLFATNFILYIQMYGYKNLVYIPVLQKTNFMFEWPCIFD